MAKQTSKEVAARLRAIADEAESGQLSDLSMSELETFVTGSGTLPEGAMKRADWDKLDPAARHKVFTDRVRVVD